MRLYATIKSDRASKGQGGNKDILVVFTAEITKERQEIMSVAIVNTIQGYYTVDIKLPDGQMIHQKVSKGEVYETKGKKQKTAKCTDQYWHTECKGCKICQRGIDQD